jgi:hypothetical protein
LRRKLEAAVDLEFDAGPLKDTLQFLSERYDLSIFVDNEAFKTMLNAPDVENANVKLAKVRGVKLRRALSMLLAQLQADFLEQDGMVVVLPQIFFTNPEYLRKLPVRASFTRKPLHDALEELADATGVSVVIDQRAVEKAQTPVSANLMNISLEAAVRILADMADLKAVPIGNMLYVTSPENAKSWRHEADQTIVYPGAVAPHPASQ